MSKKRHYWLGIAGIVLSGVIFSVFLWDFWGLPYEDAAILYRYAKHLGEGHGIVWNVGEPPVDGATDFLYMLCLGGLHRLGIPLAAGAAGLNLLSWLAGCVLAWRFLLKRAGLPAAVAGTAFLVVSPLWVHITAGFAVTFAGYWLLYTWTKIETLVAEREAGAPKWVAAGALSAICGVVRPELGLLALLMGVFALVYHSRRPSRSALAGYLAGFFILAGIYAVWRYWYFGQLFPAPFYVKQSTHFSPTHIFAGLRLLIEFAALPALLILAGLLRKPLQRFAFRQLAVLGFFVVFFTLVNLETNFYLRYQFSIFPVLVVVGFAFLPRLLDRKILLKPFAMGVFGLFVLVNGVETVAEARDFARVRDGRQDVGLILNGFGTVGNSLMTTEAGLLPLASDWTTIDALGLNDYEIAQNGFNLHFRMRPLPDVVMFHVNPAEPMNSRNAEAVEKLQRLVKMYNYELVGKFCGRGEDCHYYYAWHDFSELTELKKQMLTVEYYSPWFRRNLENTAFEMNLPQ